MEQVQVTIREQTTEERMKRVLELRNVVLNGQFVLSNLKKKLAQPRAELAIAESKLYNDFENAHGDSLTNERQLEDTIAASEKEIRELVVKEYISRSAEDRKSKIVAPNLQVSVRPFRNISGAYTHADILKDVQEKYPTLLSFDREKLIKQSEIYDIVEVENPAKNLDGSTNGPATIPGIKEMPYIELGAKVSATIKEGFWKEGQEEIDREAASLDRG